MMQLRAWARDNPLVASAIGADEAFALLDEMVVALKLAGQCLESNDVAFTPRGDPVYVKEAVAAIVRRCEEVISS